MNSWLLSIIGVIFLGLMLEILYPNGKTNAFCKTIFGAIALAILIKPLTRINTNITNSNTNNYIDNTLINNIDLSKNNYYKLKIEKTLNDNNIFGVNVEIEGKTEDNEYIIENIMVDTSDLVLSENITNINKYEVISNIILEVTRVDSERIVIYG